MPNPNPPSIRTYPITIVDVFAERRLAGNQLAVVHTADSLSDEEMQSIALETNFSETTFVTIQGDGWADVRIFTPAWELPFAGHPTIGTAAVLCEGQGDIVLNLGAGAVHVQHKNGLGWMTPPEVQFHGSLDVATAAELVGLSEDAISDDLPVELAEVGPKFVLIPVKELSQLKQAQLNGELHQQLKMQGLGVQCVFLFTEDAYSAEADFASRMFFESAGVREDPATGSANTAFAAYLRKHRGNVGDVVVDQGVEINRPSRLYLQVQDTVKVGGKTQWVVQGELRV